MTYLRTLKNGLCILGGLALVAYSIICLAGVEHIVLGKNPGARDSIGTPLLLLLLGGTSVLYGMSGWTISKHLGRSSDRDVA